MVSTMVVDRQQQYQGYQAFDNHPVELLPRASAADYEVVIRAAYRQVLGNAYVMECERLKVPESQLKLGEITVREFVRWLAKSSLYRARFVENCYRYRTIELNFKHLLGRAPDSFEEMRYHSGILDQEGFEADIDSYLDSDEYLRVFGEMTVPYYRGYKTQPGQSMLEFTNMLQLLRSASSSDKAVESNKPRLVRSLILNRPYGVEQYQGAETILADVFDTQPTSTVPSVPAWASTPPVSQTRQSLQRQFQEQKALIENLQKQLQELRPLASVGASVIRQGAFSSAAPVEPSLGTLPSRPQFPQVDSLTREVGEQAERIAELKQQISEARSLSAIGEFRLNRWRQRTFF